MMRSFRKKNVFKILGIGTLLLVLSFLVFLYLLGSQETFKVREYYGYDRDIPLKETLALIKDTTDYRLYHVQYSSVGNKKVTGLLSIPKKGSGPLPVIILVHGLGDHKAVDYIEYGNSFFLNNGYAVMRIDLSEHGERKGDRYKFDLTGPYKHWSRNIIVQSVFDLKRAVDFLETRKELDPARIGYYGISLGGIIGTVFSGTDNRIKVPVVALAGGQLNLLYKEGAMNARSKEFVSIIEPLNFVGQISPRPFLMLNAENDEVVPPLMSKLLINAAKKPKDIIWYKAKHKDAPIDQIYGDGLQWFNKYL
ncbi:MAG TPA: acetylxylan esterase [Arenibacter sp.]|nr:acetylxylan esterase [Arenibacter sp.]